MNGDVIDYIYMIMYVYKVIYIYYNKISGI